MRICFENTLSALYLVWIGPRRAAGKARSLVVAVQDAAVAKRWATVVDTLICRLGQGHRKPLFTAI